MFCLFAGGAIGSTPGIALFEGHGWKATACEAIAFLAIGAASLAVHTIRKRRAPKAEDSAEASDALPLAPAAIPETR